MSKESRSTDSWITEETKTADLGDVRLNKRLGNVLDMLSRKPTESIPVASNDWSETKAAYRFFDNPNVTGEKILQPHRDATIGRMRQESVVLLPQDTTELDYSSKPQTAGLGKLHYEAQSGMYLHPTIAVTPARVCLGIVDFQIVIRKELKKTQSHLLPIMIAYMLSDESYPLLRLYLHLTPLMKIPRSRTLPIEEKESVRWLNSYRVAQELAKELPDTKIVSIADREGDIYEIFVEATEEKKDQPAEFIIRSNQNRRLTIKGNEKEYKKIRKKLDESPVISIIEFDLPATNGRKARRVTQEIRSANVPLRPPQRNEKKLPSVVINAVLAREINVPSGVEPIEWVLLTSLPIDTAQNSLDVITWYLCRWQIEIFFKILKSGCAIEELQLQTLDRLMPCLVLYMIIARRILYMTMLGRHCPEMPCTAVFEDEEWQAVYIVTYRRPPPVIPPNLSTMIKMIASLGGFLNRKKDWFPGPKTIWIGLQRTKDFVIAMEALNASQD